MGILSNIFHKIFPGSHPAAQQQTAQPSVQSAQGMQQSAPQGQQYAAPQGQAAPQQPAAQPAAQPQTMQQVDVEAMLDEKAKSAGQPLNWRTSIVDLLKLLDLDSSLQSRKELANELNYAGDMNDSAKMNVWLHRQVMNKIAANGGKVPSDLKD
ncbi:DUF3597 domain-containing protein [Massilia arenosa]|uniref:DUF3597 domain-containing protein n=1 Tax=Zemynaea arenosa TaxID=2561931 RepID=A0A4Y9S7L3_9BURK|nr:DUF3597 domain-containing protein [Massilia arenosa]TFW15717.1 DUF3597 domain-containing protein [Massilia arenosa]